MRRNRRVRLEHGDYTSGGIHLEEEEDLDEEFEYTSGIIYTEEEEDV